MTEPTWEQIFKWPAVWPTPIVPCPAAWQGDSLAVHFANQECARLMVAALTSPPIRTRREFDKAVAQAKARRVHYAS